MISVTHGDPRLDNFYFNDSYEDGAVGLLDWQLMGISCVATDISWALCFHDLPGRKYTRKRLTHMSGTAVPPQARGLVALRVYLFAVSTIGFQGIVLTDGVCTVGFPDDCDQMVADYFTQLQALGAATDRTLADLKEQVALAHLYSLGKAVIGTGGLANADTHALQVRDPVLKMMNSMLELILMDFVLKNDDLLYKSADHAPLEHRHAEQYEEGRHRGTLQEVPGKYCKNAKNAAFSLGIMAYFARFYSSFGRNLVVFACAPRVLALHEQSPAERELDF